MLPGESDERGSGSGGGRGGDGRPRTGARGRRGFSLGKFADTHVQEDAKTLVCPCLVLASCLVPRPSPRAVGNRRCPDVSEGVRRNRRSRPLWRLVSHRSDSLLEAWRPRCDPRCRGEATRVPETALDLGFLRGGERPDLFHAGTTVLVAERGTAAPHNATTARPRTTVMAGRLGPDVPACDACVLALSGASSSCVAIVQASRVLTRKSRPRGFNTPRNEDAPALDEPLDSTQRHREAGGEA